MQQPCQETNPEPRKQMPFSALPWAVCSTPSAPPVPWVTLALENSSVSDCWEAVRMSMLVDEECQMLWWIGWMIVPPSFLWAFFHLPCAGCGTYPYIFLDTYIYIHIYLKESLYMHIYIYIPILIIITSMKGGVTTLKYSTHACLCQWDCIKASWEYKQTPFFPQVSTLWKSSLFSNSCEIKRVAKSFSVGKLKDFFLFQIKNITENVINFTSSNCETLFTPNYFCPRLYSVLRISSGILKVLPYWNFKGVAT